MTCMMVWRYEDSMYGPGGCVEDYKRNHDQAAFDECKEQAESFLTGGTQECHDRYDNSRGSTCLDQYNAALALCVAASNSCIAACRL